MKRFFKRLTLVIIALFIVLSFPLIACKQPNNSISDDFLEGVETGRKDMFISLYNASDIEYFSSGETWETEHFSLYYIDHQSGDDSYFTYCITLNHFTADYYFEKEKMFFNIYSVVDTQWNCILGYDDWYMYALLQDEDSLGCSAKAEVQLYDDVQELVSIIIIDGCLYTAIYYL